MSYLVDRIVKWHLKNNDPTVLCTSLQMTTVGYYNENDMKCYLLLLNASNVLNHAEYVKLLTMLRDRKTCPIVPSF